MARIRVYVVGSEARLHQLVGGITLPNRPLARAEHRNSGRPPVAQRTLELSLHDVEGFRPAHRSKFAVLVVVAVSLPQQRCRQPILAVHDLRQKITLDAVQSAIDLVLDIAAGCNYPIVSGCYHDAATYAAEATRGFRPFERRVAIV